MLSSNSELALTMNMLHRKLVIANIDFAPKKPTVLQAQRPTVTQSDPPDAKMAQTRLAPWTLQ